MRNFDMKYPLIIFSILSYQRTHLQQTLNLFLYSSLIQ